MDIINTEYLALGLSLIGPLDLFIYIEYPDRNSIVWNASYLFYSSIASILFISSLQAVASITQNTCNLLFLAASYRFRNVDYIVP